MIVEKEKKLFTTTRKKWETVGEDIRLRLAIVGFYKQEECNKEVEELFEQGGSLNDPESILNRVNSDSLLFSSFVRRELEKHSEEYQNLSFIAEYSMLREKWKRMDSKKRKRYNPIQMRTQ